VLQEIVVAARNIRAEMKLDQKKKVSADFSTGDPAVRKLVELNIEPVLRLATLSELAFSSGHLDPSSGAIRSSSQFDLRIAHGAGVDKEAELARLKKEIERLAKDIESKRNRLADETFRQKAPAEIVRGIETTLAERQIELQKLLERLAQLK
jgi:valyl-tRNA synthetase